MSRFVILEHDHPHLHWDFMLEDGQELRTWRLESAPVAGSAVYAIALGGHRLFYLDYEGPVSGGRGHVKRWDYGTFLIRNKRPEEWQVELQGQKIQGICLLKQADGQNWQAIFGAKDDTGIIQNRANKSQNY